MRQVPELSAVLAVLKFWDGWSFKLEEWSDRGLVLVITIQTVDAYHPENPYQVQHNFAVPPATHNEHNWARWVLEQILLVQRHEAMEAFVVNGKRPFEPGHGGGHDPYYPVHIY